MIYESYIPDPPLNQFIECFIYYRDYQPFHSVDRFLPDGNVHVVIDLTDFPKFIYNNETLKEIQSCQHVWFSGIRKQFITIPSGRDSEMFIIQFQKGKAYPFTEMPMDQLTDSVVDGNLVMTNEIMILREILLDAPEPVDKFRKAETFLQKCYGRKLIHNPFVDFAVQQIMAKPDQSSIMSIAQKVGYTQKHVIKLFREHVGLTPKSFLKIVRFQKALQEIELTKTIDWTRVSFESGYYDQSHFIQDFKQFSGFTPTQYLQSRGEYINYVAVG